FMSEQPPLAVKSPCIPGKRCVAAHHTMARQHDRNRIERIRHAHGAGRFWSADPGGKPGVGKSLPHGNIAQRGPDLLLKRRTPGMHRYCRQTPVITGKIPGYPRAETVRVIDLFQRERRITAREQAHHPLGIVFKIERTEFVAVNNDDYLPYGGWYVIDEQFLHPGSLFLSRWFGVTLPCVSRRADATDYYRH